MLRPPPTLNPCMDWKLRPLILEMTFVPFLGSPPSARVALRAMAYIMTASYRWAAETGTWGGGYTMLSLPKNADVFKRAYTPESLPLPPPPPALQEFSCHLSQTFPKL